MGQLAALLTVAALACDEAEPKTTRDTAKLHEIRNFRAAV